MSPGGPPPSEPDPLLSVVVTVIDGGAVLERFLEALTRQEDPPPLEIIVPHDASIRGVAAMQAQFPGTTFLDIGAIVPERPIASAAGQHELYDRRRARGLALAKGAIVAILEDRGVPRADWARSTVRLHQRLPHGVIGGAIEPAKGGLLNFAFWVTDFGRYGLPFDGAPARWVSDVNVSYKRRVLDATRDLWKERFREPVVHWALEKRGETLFLSPDVVVIHCRPPTGLGVLVPERFHWGRLFGHIRAMHIGLGKRIVYALLSPLIPPMLIVRHGVIQARKGRLLRYLAAIPLVALLTTCWTAGEALGTLTRRA